MNRWLLRVGLDEDVRVCDRCAEVLKDDPFLREGDGADFLFGALRPSVRAQQCHRCQAGLDVPPAPKEPETFSELVEELRDLQDTEKRWADRLPVSRCRGLQAERRSAASGIGTARSIVERFGRRMKLL